MLVPGTQDVPHDVSVLYSLLLFVLVLCRLFSRAVGEGGGQELGVECCLVNTDPIGLEATLKFGHLIIQAHI